MVVQEEEVETHPQGVRIMEEVERQGKEMLGEQELVMQE